MSWIYTEHDTDYAEWRLGDKRVSIYDDCISNVTTVEWSTQIVWDRMDGPAVIKIQSRCFSILRQFGDPSLIDGWLEKNLVPASFSWYVGGMHLSFTDVYPLAFPCVDIDFIRRKIDESPDRISAWIRVARRLGVFNEQALAGLELLL